MNIQNIRTDGDNIYFRTFFREKGAFQTAVGDIDHKRFAEEFLVFGIHDGIEHGIVFWYPCGIDTGYDGGAA